MRQIVGDAGVQAATMHGEAERKRLQLLIRRAQLGDAEAISLLVRAHEQKLFYYVRSLVTDEADAWDVMQRTWIGVIRGLDRLENPTRFVPWLYTIARRTACKRYRPDLLRNHARDAADVDSISTDDPWMPRLEDVEAVHVALRKLTEPHREVLTLHFLEDMSVADVADVLAIAPGTVKSRIHHAKQALRRLLQEDIEHES